MRLYDYILVLITIFLLVVIGGLSFYGTIYSWITSLSNPGWESSPVYQEYLQRMNAYAYPFIVGLVLVLCMCIPKRIIPREVLLQSSVLLLGVTVLLALLVKLQAGLAFILIISIILQSLVVVLTLARSKGLVFEREGLLIQLGSGIFHLGLVLWIFDFILLQESPAHLTIFWISTVLMALGVILSFYSREVSRIFGKSSFKQHS